MQPESRSRSVIGCFPQAMCNQDAESQVKITKKASRPEKKRKISDKSLEFQGENEINSDEEVDKNQENKDL